MTKTKDPVCGTIIDRDKSHTHSSDVGGESYYFCSQECQERFEENPKQFIPLLRPEDWDPMTRDLPSTM